MRAELARVTPVAVAAIGLCLLAPAAGAQDGPPPRISDIRQETTEFSTRLVVECDGPMAYTYYSPDPLTLVVDIPEVDASSLPARVEVGTREVESLRVTQLARADGRNLARVEVRLASLVPYQIFSKDRQLHLLFERAESAAASPAPRAAAAAPAPAVEPVAPPPAPAQVVVAPEPDPLPAAPVRPSGPRATQILAVLTEGSGADLSVRVKADGQLDYQDFFLGNPDRLVFDFMDVSARASRRQIDVGEGGVQRIRVAQFSADSPRVARMVLDLDARTPYRVEPASDGLRVLFGEGRAPASAPMAALKPATPQSVYDPVAPSRGKPVGYSGPAGLEPALPMLQEPPLPPQEPRVIQAEGSSSPKWTGHPISLDFKDGDLQDIFRLFADITGLNVVVNPGVSGRVTLVLKEVPWDQALDLILKVNSLGYVIENNVLRIASLADLSREEQERRQLEEEKALAGELVTEQFRLSYAKGSELRPTIEAVALSPRGSMELDARTNTMIVTDLERHLSQVRSLIRDLDRATPQVEIEARIVVTTRNFTRDIGIQWGFSSRQVPQFGNTTNRSFPNSIVINGSGVPGQGLAADNSLLDPGTEIGPAGRGYAVNLPAAGFTSALGVSLGNILGNFNLDAALTALERQGRGRLLSSPKVTTQNNQAATIKQGVQIPIQTVANNTVTVQFRDAVLTLGVTPQITAEKTVILNLQVENNAPDFANLVQGIPPINTQSAVTNVLVRNGETAVIGGIYQSTEQTTRNNVPFFSKIPLLGLLFRNDFARSENQELLIFVTPRIIES